MSEDFNGAIYTYHAGLYTGVNKTMHDNIGQFMPGQDQTGTNKAFNEQSFSGMCDSEIQTDSGSGSESKM